MTTNPDERPDLTPEQKNRFAAIHAAKQIVSADNEYTLLAVADWLWRGELPTIDTTDDEPADDEPSPYGRAVPIVNGRDGTWNTNQHGAA